MSSFLQYKRHISEGDTVIVCRGREKIFPVRVQRGKVVQVRGGAVHHDSLIGKDYGSKVRTSNGKSWVFVLHPTPELWTVTLPHRTQILYSMDISIITLYLGLRPGSVVVECGTGSGSLSHAIARTIAPTGHLYTFEFHEQRAKIAREEFVDHGLSELVTLTCRDVCKEGFGLENMADAVFLDLPVPWEAIDSAKTALKDTGGKLCSFSPCIEQAQRTCQKLEQCQFVDLEVLECLQRPFDVKQYSMDIPNLGYPLEEEESAMKKRRLETTGVHVTEGEREGTAHVTEGEREGAAHVTEGEQEGTAHVTESEQESTAHVTEGEREGTAHVTEGEREGAAHVTEGEREGTVHVTEGEREGTAHVTEGEQEGIAHVTEGEREGTAHVTEGEQEGTAHVTEGEREGTAHVTEGEQEGTAHVTEGEQEGTAHVTEGEREGVTDAVTMADGCVAKMKRTSAYKKRKLVRPTLSSCAMYTAQPRKNIPGHTGYLTFATLHTKQKRSGATNEPTALACAC